MEGKCIKGQGEARRPLKIGRMKTARRYSLEGWTVHCSIYPDVRLALAEARACRPVRRH